MTDIEKRKGDQPEGKNLPERRFLRDIELHMDHIEFDDETEDYEALATKRSMRRGIELAEYGMERAGKNEAAQQVAFAHIRAFTENSLARQRRRMMGGY
ncbi:hypothetical protein RCF27_09495 [Rhodococcus pyridinivorans]|uniref:hypothetical protein n=1 Tax=Rhodococcus pyridinivorans TaxID=103816 RepID=UPI00280C2071|nr:hypothetical protein [Rhodococcus pyridinivorans]WMM74492.1 hypothetical protein RCF27_09495 [Rhodococcus pyridinivorans]